MLSGQIDLPLNGCRARQPDLYGAFRRQRDLARRGQRAVDEVRLDGLSGCGQVNGISPQMGLLGVGRDEYAGTAHKAARGSARRIGRKHGGGGKSELRRVPRHVGEQAADVGWDEVHARCPRLLQLRSWVCMYARSARRGAHGVGSDATTSLLLAAWQFDGREPSAVKHRSGRLPGRRSPLRLQADQQLSVQPQRMSERRTRRRQHTE